MSQTQLIFNSSRFTQLLKREIALTSKPFLYMTLSIIGIFLIGDMVSLNQSITFSQTLTGQNLNTCLGFIMIIWASISFSETATSPGRQAYLSLPASHLEKLAAKWTNISLIIPLGFSTTFILSSLASSFLIHNYRGEQVDYAGFPPSSIFVYFLFLAAVQTIFYMGSIIWPRYSLFKTGLSIIVFIFATSAILALVAGLIFRDFGSGLVFQFDNTHEMNLPISDDALITLITLTGALFFLTVTYFKLKEKEL